MRRSVASAASLLLAICAVLSAILPAEARDWQDADSPFRMAEGYADTPATCETIGDWIDHAPKTDARFSFTIEGRLVASEWDGVLAYLIMCDEAGTQVMCVTYSDDGRTIGQPVQFAGGWNRIGEKQVILDPCLARPLDD